jgi:Ras GTPase-activating-like protein IQGAP2/3
MEAKLKHNKNNIIKEHQFSEPDILAYYENSFLQVIEIIDMIYDKLINNIDSLPFSIKCICKIISILISKKFPDSKRYEKNSFIGKFIFQILVFPSLLFQNFNIK